MAPSISSIVPGNPSSVMSIRRIHPAVTTVSTPFARLGRFAFGGRATMVRLATGSVAVFSPVALTSEVRTALSELSGKAEESSSPSPTAVGYLVAPDMEHHIFLSEWKRAFPSAKIIGPEGLEDKRRQQARDPKKRHPNVSDDAFFKTLKPGDTKSGDDAFDAEFDIEYLSGTVNKEVAVLHRPSRTLIQADLMFNFPAREQYSRVPEKDQPKEGFTGLTPFGNWIFNRIGRTDGDLTWPRRFVWYGTAGKDKALFAKNIQRIDSWDFENIVPCHGDTMMGDGKERFRNLFAWHLHDKKE